MKKKVLILGPFPEPITGLSLCNKTLYNGLLKSNYKVDIINLSYNQFEENIGGFSIKKVMFYFKINFQAIKIFNHDTIVITIGQSFFGVIKYSIFIILAKLLNREIIIHLHGNMLGMMYKELSKFKKNVIKGILKYTNKAIVLAPSHKFNFKYFISPNQIYVLPNFVQDSLFPEKKKLIKKPSHLLKIIFLSNLMTEKGVFYLLEALKALNEKGLVFEAKLAGNIDLNIEKKIHAKINKLHNIEYLGIVGGQKKRQLLLWGNVFLFPSNYNEGFPISILEAMLYKNIIISTKHSSLVDFFNSESIIYIDKKSSTSIVDALDNVSKKMKSYSEIVEKNSNFVKNKFSEKRFINNFLKILNS